MIVAIVSTLAAIGATYIGIALRARARSFDHHDDWSRF